MIRTSFYLIAITFAIGCRQAVEPPLNKSPLMRQALAGFELAEGFRIEPVAMEPLVADPVAMDIDENGLFYVVEMHGYPEDTSGSGLVKLLRDTDQDGWPDSSRVFADGLILPTGIMKWKEGVIVTDPPHVWYMEDTDGDDRADVKKILLTGFALSNPQHNANTPVFGLDNWIYVAHQYAITPTVSKIFSDEGQEIYFPERPLAARLPKNADDRNIRFKPDDYAVEMLAANSQYGQTFSPWGHHFLTENAKHIYHEVLADRYLRRNPHLLIPDVVQHVSDHGAACTVYPITTNPQHQLLTDLGVITAACGITWYDGGAFPPPYDQNITFVAEPVHNLIHVDRLTDDGPSFKASRLEQDKEFLASRDALFRPSMLYIGPEGALYVIDYYRPIIEHPEWMSDEVNRSGRLYEGSNQGRIYRIVPDSGLKMDWMKTLSLGKAEDTALVRLLSHPNSWYRRTAQRLLYQRKSQAWEAMRLMVQDNSHPEGQVHALWLLNGLEGLVEKDIADALGATHPGVRENALRIAELNYKKWPALVNSIKSIAQDTSAKVRFQLLCTLGEFPDSASTQLRWALLKQNIADEWMQTAALTAAGQEKVFFDLAIHELSAAEKVQAAKLFAKLAVAISQSASPDQGRAFLSQLITASTEEDAIWQCAALEGLQALWARRGVPQWVGSPEKTQLLRNFTPGVHERLRSLSVNLLTLVGGTGRISSALLAEASQWAKDSILPLSLRVDAMRLLKRAKTADQVVLVEQLLVPSTAEPLQEAALDLLAAGDETAFWPTVLKHWPVFTPALKDKAIGHALRSRNRMLQLLESIQDGHIKTSSISWPRQVRLMNNDYEDVRLIARKIFTAPDQSARQQVVDRYRPALEGTPNLERGALVYERACASCHQWQGQGIAFGPDLGTVRNRDPYFILADILHPNRALADAFELWNIDYGTDLSVSGVISSESSTALTIKKLDGQEETIARQEIRTMQASPISAMPDGLESSISVEEMRDLIAFIKRGGALKNTASPVN